MMMESHLIFHIVGCSSKLIGLLLSIGEMFPSLCARQWILYEYLKNQKTTRVFVEHKRQVGFACGFSTFLD